MRKTFSLFAIFSLLIVNLFSLNREYRSDCDEDNRFQDYYNPCCSNHAPCGFPDWIFSNLIKLIPATGAECIKCNKKSIYLGYLDPDFKKYRSHFINQLQYYKRNSNCDCYWPEYSSRASKINDSAYLLFRELISNTALSDLLKYPEEQRIFIGNPGWFLNSHGLTVSFIAQQFRFSDYYHVCKDIENYSVSHYSERDVAKISDKLEHILEALYAQFFSLYQDCFAKHSNLNIEQEIRLMKLLVYDTSTIDILNVPHQKSSCEINETLRTTNLLVELEKNETRKENFFNQPSMINKKFNSNLNKMKFDDPIVSRNFSIQSEILLEQGCILNCCFLYKKSIDVLTQALNINFYNREAYIERAMAYFETNQIELALKDYNFIKKLTIPPFKSTANQKLRGKYIPDHKTDFAKGLLNGILEGGLESGKEFIPSVLSCCRGILHGLWAFASSPSQVSQEMIDTAYAIGEYITSHDALECFECVVPELKDLSLTWHNIDDHHKGKKIGYIIGKYGIEIFAPLGLVKANFVFKSGITKYKKFHRANIVQTLERCAESSSVQKKILERSAEFAAKREMIIQEAAKNGSLLIKTDNVINHVMQEHHHWEKVIELTGNKIEDFKKVIGLVENNKIIQKINIHDTFIHKNLPIKVIEYRMEIKSYEVAILMESYFETGESFLKNAYVIKPK